MRKLISTILVFVIWGLLVWGNVALINYANHEYQDRIASNYLVNTYEGRILLSRLEYSEFNKSLLSEEVRIHTLDVYGTDEILVIYDLTVPETYPIPFVGEPQSQDWHLPTGRDGTNILLAMAIFFSIALGTFLTKSMGLRY